MNQEELKIWTRLNECEYVKKVKGHYWLVGDRCVNLFSQVNDIYTIGHSISVDDLDSIWIPPLYDPIRPERSLWYMSGDIRWNWPEQEKLGFMIDACPDLALARAIIEQEGK